MLSVVYSHTNLYIGNIVTQEFIGKHVTATDLTINIGKWAPSHHEPFPTLTQVKAAGLWKLEKHAGVRRYLASPAITLSLKATSDAEVGSLQVGSRQLLAMKLGPPGTSIPTQVPSNLPVQALLVMGPEATDPGVFSTLFCCA